MPTLERRVLVVDDEESIRKAFAKGLARIGCHVKTAASGEEAMEIMRAEPAWVLFLDLNLPGMDGLALLERLRATGVRLPAILITTNPRTALRNRAAAAGVPIIEKPLLTDALLTTVRKALARRA